MHAHVCIYVHTCTYYHTYYHWYADTCTHIYLTCVLRVCIHIYTNISPVNTCQCVYSVGVGVTTLLISCDLNIYNSLFNCVCNLACPHPTLPLSPPYMICAPPYAHLQVLSNQNLLAVTIKICIFGLTREMRKASRAKSRCFL